MAIRFAVLALLAEGPLHGYAVHAVFEERLGDFVDLNYGRVYQVLIALERQGHVRASESRVGRRPFRKVYALTPSGRDLLDRWLRESKARSRTPRDDFYVRLVLAVRLCPEHAPRLVEEQLAVVRAEVAALRLRRTALPRGGAGDELVRRLFVEAALLRGEATVKALEASRIALRSELGLGDGARLRAGETVAERGPGGPALRRPRA
jgi:DNA-binding PadR family transcriptional regulator